MEEVIREPKQKRAIEKKEKIVEAGFQLICQNGYYNTNTAEIAREAGVSTGIVYQYFKDKHDIFMEGLEKYGDEIFFPMLKLNSKSFNVSSFDDSLQSMIQAYIKDHKLSQTAHEEITSMVHSDSDVADYFYRRELWLTETIKNILLENHFQEEHLNEKVHVMIGLIDQLCHEVAFHKHSTMDYSYMTKLVLQTIHSIFQEDLEA